jgi:hypothetical protein
MFVRSLLLYRSTCIMTGTAFAAPTAEQPLNPKVIRTQSVQDPIDPLAIERKPLSQNTSSASSPVSSPVTNSASAPAANVAATSSPASSDQAQVSAQEEHDLNQASATLQNLESSETKNADTGVAPTLLKKQQPRQLLQKLRQVKHLGHLTV